MNKSVKPRKKRILPQLMTLCTKLESEIQECKNLVGHLPALEQYNAVASKVDGLYSMMMEFAKTQEKDFLRNLNVLRRILARLNKREKHTKN